MTAEQANARMIDRWFPCDAVDTACRTPIGSGRSEKAIFPWFASRPIAQARAAVLTALLEDDPALRQHVEAAVRTGDSTTMTMLNGAVQRQYGRPPVVLDLFSGRAMIPLEAARAGATAVATDLSPVATLAGRLLADWSLRDWSAEPPLPFKNDDDEALDIDGAPRLVADARALHTELGRRLRETMGPHYPASPEGGNPWGYLWAVTMPCDGCRRRFPLFGSSVLRHPYRRTHDAGQAFKLWDHGDDWSIEVQDGASHQVPTYSSSGGRKGKSARCPFCAHIHSLETVKAKGAAQQFEDEPIAVADFDGDTRKVFRSVSKADRAAALGADPAALPHVHGLTPVPDEAIPAGNVHTVMASGYGYTNYGVLMNKRQTLMFGMLAKLIRESRDEMKAAGASDDYAAALTSLAAATFVRMLKHATRGARLRGHGNEEGSGQNRVQIDHIFSNEASLSFQFDYFEAGIHNGPGTWTGLTETGLKPLAAHLEGARGKPARVRRANAMALPFRDGSVDAVITDPPYYDMIEYADASDYFYVWLRRILVDAQPDLFSETVGTVVAPDLQDKDNEIIVRRVYNGGIKHDKPFYEASLGKAFAEARRVLRADGHLVVVFGHSDPDAWKRLLGALHDAGFVVTSSWPSRTESGNTGVASIKITVTIGCRVAAVARPAATADQVDGEVADAVRHMVPQWEKDGLALQDQMMAAYGPAMEVYGKYKRIIRPDGSEADLEGYLLLARRAVRDATALKLDQMPLETFDAATRVAVFWLRAYGRTDVSKGEARFIAQLDGLRMEGLRDSILSESKSGFKLITDDAASITPASSTFEVVRAMAHAWADGGTEAVGGRLVAGDRLPNDEHVWAVVGELVNQLPAADAVAKALTSIQRNRDAIAGFVLRAAARAEQHLGQMTLDQAPQADTEDDH